MNFTTARMYTFYLRKKQRVLAQFSFELRLTCTTLENSPMSEMTAPNFTIQLLTLCSAGTTGQRSCTLSNSFKVSCKKHSVQIRGLGTIKKFNV